MALLCRVTGSGHESGIRHTQNTAQTRIPSLQPLMSTTAERRRSILVIDDEPYIGRIIQLKLEATPYDVDVCQDGSAALERLRTEEPVDLILLDIMMPSMSGFEVLARLREIPHRKATPVIMLTGKGQSTDREQAASLGARDFLTKPFSPKKLLARIDEIFDA
jgi:DNA-binding response OmpR family regulator